MIVAEKAEPLRRVSPTELCLVLLLGGLLAVIWTWPLAPNLGSALPYDRGFVPAAGADTHIWVWNFWWVQEALSVGHSPFFSDAIFPPRGAGLGLHTHAILYGFLALPLTAAFGAVFAVGAAILALFASAFAAMWGLARALGASRPAALLAAFGWAFAPYFLQKGLEHLNLMAAPWPPLLCLFLLRWMGSGRVRPALGAGCVVGLAALAGPLVMVQTVLFGVLVCAFAPGEGLRRRELLRPWPLFLGSLAGALLASPALLSIRRELASAASFAKSFGELGLGGGPSLVTREVLARPSLVDFVRLPHLHPLSGGGLEGTPGGNEIAALHVSASLLVLAVIAVLLGRPARRKVRGLWAGLACLCFLLAWDPGLPFGHPSELYRQLPLMDGLRVPARFMPYGLLALALLAAEGATELVQRSGARIGGAAVGVLGCLLVFESWPRSLPLMELDPPVAVASLANEAPLEGAGRVLTLPAQFGASEAMTWQSQHGRGVVASYLARVDPWVTRGLELGTPDLFKLLVPALSADGSLRVPEPDALALDLFHLEVGTILVDRSAFGDGGALFDVLAQLLDDMPGWQYRGTEGRLAVWQRIAPG